MLKRVLPTLVAMNPVTAITFIFLGVAVWRKQSGRIDLSTVLIVLSIVGSFLPIVGYLYGTKPFYGIGQSIPMALHTAFTFLMLGVGLLGTLLIERLQSNVAAFNARQDLRYTISLSVGLVLVEPDEMLTLDDILKAADARMYSDKQARKNLTPPAFRLMPRLV